MCLAPLLGMETLKRYNVLLVYGKCLIKMMEERARMAIALARNGRTPQDISACLDAALPLPEIVDLKENAATDNN